MKRTEKRMRVVVEKDATLALSIDTPALINFLSVLG